MMLARPIIFILATLFAGQCLASDLPQRRSGLWELRNQMAGMPAQGPMQMCIDQSSDELMQERATNRANCSVMDVSRSAGKVIIHSVCRQDHSTATSDTVISGDFEKAYRSEMNIRYAPAQHGIGKLKMTQEAHWLGPCKPGQKPGDIMMPGQPTLNMQEMLRQQQAAH